MSASSAPEVDLGNYEVLADFALEYAPVQVTKYRSKKTGLQAVVGNHKGKPDHICICKIVRLIHVPLLSPHRENDQRHSKYSRLTSLPSSQTNAYFIVATETFDDSGRPHTLEHLIFLGLKSYPYKGVLDGLANRAGGNGTNAWTADDHTAYTISTAGSEGFLNLLPIFLEHILYPTLTKEGYITEVYHINGKGEEAGVVMSEMQGVEQQSTSVLMRQLQLEMYPQGSAYRSETGGMLGALRKLTIEEIREFHAHAYKPWNICLHVDGSIPTDQLMRILNHTMDPMILANTTIKADSVIPATWRRPFLETPSAAGPVIERNMIKVVPFMDKDDTVGEVVVAWKGTKTGDHLGETVSPWAKEVDQHREEDPTIGFLRIQALGVLKAYLTDSEVAPLSKRFVEIAQPACTSIKIYSQDRASHCEISFHIQGINNVNRVSDCKDTQLDRMAEDLKEALSEIAQAGVDMVRMKAIIERDRRQLLSSAETSVTDVLTDSIVASRSHPKARPILLMPKRADFLYGDKDSNDLEHVFDDLKWYDTLLGWRSEQWCEMITA